MLHSGAGANLRVDHDYLTANPSPCWPECFPGIQKPQGVTERVPEPDLRVKLGPGSELSDGPRWRLFLIHYPPRIGDPSYIMGSPTKPPTDYICG